MMKNGVAAVVCRKGGGSALEQQLCNLRTAIFGRYVERCLSTVVLGVQMNRTPMSHEYPDTAPLPREAKAWSAVTPRSLIDRRSAPCVRSILRTAMLEDDG